MHGCVSWAAHIGVIGLWCVPAVPAMKKGAKGLILGMVSVIMILSNGDGFPGAFYLRGKICGPQRIY